MRLPLKIGLTVVALGALGFGGWIFSLPEALIVELGPPPAGHRYVRVASDILLIAAITGMVIETVQDLGRM